jgi:hypothetical protein
VTRKKALLALERMTQEKLLSIAEGLLTSQEQLKQFLGSPYSEQLNTLGKGGDMSQMDLIATLTQWYDTLPQKQKTKCWMLIVDFLMLGTLHGMPSRDLNF